MADPTHGKSYVHADTNPVTKYIWKHSLREPEFLVKIRDETLEKLGKRSIMLVDPIESQFLRFLIGASGAKRCLEIGTFTGYNACSIALALPEDGEVIACDINDTFLSIGKPFWPEECAKKIKVKLAPAVETLDKLIADGESGKFDFAFIDADKGNYDNYYEKSLVLLKKGGIIAVDNAIWSGKVTGNEAEFDEDTKTIHNLNKKIKDDQRVEISLLTVGDGTFLCKKK